MGTLNPPCRLARGAGALFLILVIGTVGYEEVYPCEDSPSVGSTIKQVEEKFPRVKMLAFRKKDGALVPSPNPETIIEKAGSLTAFGTIEQLEALERYCESSEVMAKPAKRAEGR